MLSALIRLVRSYPACYITTGTPVAPNPRSSRTKGLFHSDNYASSRYHTNCLTYILNDYAFSLYGLYLHPFFKIALLLLRIWLSLKCFAYEIIILLTLSSQVVITFQN